MFSRFSILQTGLNLWKYDQTNDLFDGIYPFWVHPKPSKWCPMTLYLICIKWRPHLKKVNDKVNSIQNSSNWAQSMKIWPNTWINWRYLSILGHPEALKMEINDVISHLHKNDVTIVKKIGDNVFLLQHPSNYRFQQRN